MTNISLADNLFIVASAMGSAFYSFTGNGISSLSEIINRVRSAPGAPRGMVHLAVRNASKGWSRNSSFYNA